MNLLLLTFLLVFCENEASTTRVHRAVAKKYLTAPDQRVWYMFDPTIPVDSAVHGCVVQAMQHVHNHSCVRLLQRTQHKAGHIWYQQQRGYILFQNNTDPNGCFAVTGLKQTGPTVVNLGQNCGQRVEVCTRELLHALGLEYEHNRPDREHYVRVFTDRIKHDLSYTKLLPGHDYDFLTPYDLSSVMHFAQGDNAVHAGVHTMQATLYMLQQSLGHSLRGTKHPLSHRDQLAVNQLFKCSAKCAYKHSCEHGGYMNEACECVCPYAFSGKRCEQLKWQKQFTARGCGLRVASSNRESYVTSPGYPEGYKAGMFCQWLIETKNAWEQIEFRIANLDLQHETVQSTSKCEDTLRVWPHGTDVDTHPVSCQPEDVARYQQQVYRTQYNWLLIELHTSGLSRGSHRGFNISYRVKDNRPLKDTAQSAGALHASVLDRLKTERVKCQTCEGHAACSQQNTSSELCALNNACAVIRQPETGASWRGCMSVSKCEQLPHRCNPSRTACTECCATHQCNSAHKPTTYISTVVFMLFLVAHVL